ncbi:MAG: hypothetical protein ACTHJJ_11425 [Intrasporangium sp.]|uniref:hypothetical protein n=1 Tax=Intrasporangium sp. TaxID=1925024 RepID=UPI003F7E3DDF
MIMLTLTAPLVGFGLVLFMERIEDRMMTATPRVPEGPRPTAPRRHRRHGWWLPDRRLVGALALGTSSALTLVVLLMV